MKLMVIESTTENKRARKRQKSMVSRAKRIVIADNSAKLLYSNLYGNTDLDSKYGEEMTAVNVQELQT